MQMFEFMLLMLAAIFLSNIINRFLPKVSVPIIQIILGAALTLLPLHFHLVLDTELFFVLFIAPIIFYNSIESDKDTLWQQRVPIISLAFGLVFVCVIIGGQLVHLLIPAIPAAAACALIAALGPTDDVAVASLSKRVNIPHKLMSILEGESVFNDASGIVSFQFAIAAMITGHFSPVKAAGQFFVISLGGIFVGLMLTGVKYLIVKWIRSLGLENMTLHILLELLTPFLIYIAAENMGTSGVFAVFTSGIVHSFVKKNLTPDNVNLNIASSSIWSMLSFTLNGLVFLLMGTQLPDIIKTISYNNYPINTFQIIAYILLITAFFAATRFLWAYFGIKNNRYSDETNRISKLKASVIISLSGARGAVTLASIMSVPLLIDELTAFPERNLLILISTGVILCSLILANFVLPELLKSENEEDDSLKENNAYIEILTNVISTLRTRSTDENKDAIEIICVEYLRRINNLRARQQSTASDRMAEQRIKAQTVEWEKENTCYLYDTKVIEHDVMEHYLSLLDSVSLRIAKNKTIIAVLKRFFGRFTHLYRYDLKRNKEGNKMEQFHSLRVGNNNYVLGKLKERLDSDETDNADVLRKVISEYELSLNFSNNRRGGGQDQAVRGKVLGDIMGDVAAIGFQIERDNIQMMFENGRISRETSKELRNNITLMEIEVEKNTL